MPPRRSPQATKGPRMPENDDFPALDEKLAERLVRARRGPRRCSAPTPCAPGSTTTNSTTRTPDCSRRSAEDPDAQFFRPALPVLAIVGPPERRQVRAGEPHPRPPRGRRGRHPRRHPRPGHLQGRVERAPSSPSSTPAAGSPMPAASTPPSPRRPRSPSTSPTSCCSSSTPRWAPPPPTSTS